MPDVEYTNRRLPTGVLRLARFARAGVVLGALAVAAGCQGDAWRLGRETCAAPECGDAQMCQPFTPVVHERGELTMFPPASRPAENGPALMSSPVPTSTAAPGAVPAAPPATVQEPRPASDEVRALSEALRSRVDDLEGRLRRQDADTQQARRESAAARQAVAQLSSEIAAWRGELESVRKAIRDQQASDLRALDDVNRTLDQVLEQLSHETEP